MKKQLLILSFLFGIVSLTQAQHFDLQTKNFEINATYQPDIRFHFDNSIIDSSSYEILDSLAGFLIQNKQLIIEIENHCDCRISEYYSSRPTRNRANSVYEYLVEKGVNKDQLTPRGYGDIRPAKIMKNGREIELTCEYINALESKEEQEKAHALNRRTVFRITGIKKDEKISFETLLDSTKMKFIPPEDYKEVQPIENGQMNYEKAYRHPTEKFEVRYAIRKHEFSFYKQIFEVTVLNISGGQLPEYTNFHPEAVKNEFGADGGATVAVPVIKEFGQDYQYCLLVYIYKKGIGDGYIFYMADDKSLIPTLMEPIFHALRFKE